MTGSCRGEGCGAGFGWASPRTLLAGGARPATHLNLPRSNFSMQRGLGSGPPGAAVSFAASFLPGAGMDLAGFAVALA